MDILSPNRPRAQFRCRIAGGRLSYEQIVAGQGTPGNNQVRRGLVVSREAVGIAWGAFYGRGGSWLSIRESAICTKTCMGIPCVWLRRAQRGNRLPICELNRAVAGGLTRPWLCSTPISGGAHED